MISGGCDRFSAVGGFWLTSCNWTPRVLAQQSCAAAEMPTDWDDAAAEQEDRACGWLSCHVGIG